MLTVIVTNTNHEVVNTFNGKTWHEVKAGVRATYPTAEKRAQVQITVTGKNGRLIGMKPMFMQAFYTLEHLV